MTRVRTVALRTMMACFITSVVCGLAPADAALTTSVTVSGTLLVAPAEREGDPPAYAIQTDDGALVEATGAALRGAQPGAHFSVRLALPPGFEASHRLSATLDRAQAQHLRLSVTSATPTAAAAAKAGVTHRWYTAAPSNFGAPGMTDAALLAQINEVAGYWTTQANHAIASITTPTAITHYTSTATTAAGGCGLTGADFWAAVQEAAAQFPGADFGGSDQLLVLMPATCVTGSISGRGTQGGLSFGNGGYSISITNSRWFEPTLAHEIGHNYGYGHSRLGPCEPACANEYGDYYSVMGAVNSGYLVPPALSTPFRVMQGITDARRGRDARQPGHDHDLHQTLRPRSAPQRTARPGPARRHRSDALRRVPVRHRCRRTAFYASRTSPSYRTGVVVDAAYNSSGTALVPDSGRNALIKGESRTFTSATAKVTVTVTAMTTSAATVKVVITGFASTRAPGRSPCPWRPRSARRSAPSSGAGPSPPRAPATSGTPTASRSPERPARP